LNGVRCQQKQKSRRKTAFLFVFRIIKVMDLPWQPALNPNSADTP
jgi:hypothetical protein